MTALTDLPPAVRASIESHATHPPLNTIRVLRDGTVWIRPSAPSAERRVRWDVFSRDGRRLGFAQFPARARVRDGERAWVLVVEPGEDDVPSIVRYRVSGY